MVRTFTDIEELVGTATELERVLGELGEIPYEPLKESKGGTRRRSFRDHDGKEGHCFEQHIHQFLQRECAKSGCTIFFHYVWMMPDLQGRRPFSHHLSKIK
jgi:hypothetical protein